MLRSQFERRGYEMKHYRKMKCRQRAHLYSMKRKETMSAGLIQILLAQKMKKIHMINSADINGR
jgi:hypothetical protein